MANMTRQHFELLAETVANLETLEVDDPNSEHGLTLTVIPVSVLVRELADMCAGTNGMFDRGRFERACTTPDYRAPRNVSRYAR